LYSISHGTSTSVVVNLTVERLKRRLDSRDVWRRLQSLDVSTLLPLKNFEKNGLNIKKMAESPISWVSTPLY